MNQIVFVVDDDDDLRSAIADLLHSVGLTVECFAVPLHFYTAMSRTRTDVYWWMSGCR